MRTFFLDTLLHFIAMAHGEWCSINIRSHSGIVSAETLSLYVEFLRINPSPSRTRA
jgi:hypothetical protein